MTITRNAELQSANWIDGVVGSTIAGLGGLKRGNVGVVDGVSYDGENPDYGTSRDEKSKIILSNGTEIWDLSGNVWEHLRIDDADSVIPRVNMPTLSTIADDGTIGGWGEFTDIDGYGMLSYDAIRPLNSLYNSDYGVGRIWTYGDDETSLGLRIALRGGSWTSLIDGGIFTMSLSVADVGSNEDIGYRCAGPAIVPPTSIPTPIPTSTPTPTPALNLRLTDITGITVNPGIYEYYYHSNSNILFKGITYPFAHVKITVNSDPKICETTADSEGNFECNFPYIENGLHTITIVATTTEGQVFTYPQLTLGINVSLVPTGTSSLISITIGIILFTFGILITRIKSTRINYK